MNSAASNSECTAFWHLVKKCLSSRLQEPSISPSSWSDYFKELLNPVVTEDEEFSNNIHDFLAHHENSVCVKKKFYQVTLHNKLL